MERCRIQGGMGPDRHHVPDNTSDLGAKKDGACVEEGLPSYVDNEHGIHVAYRATNEAYSNDLA